MGTNKGAKISTCGTYRYALWRKISSEKPAVLFVCLNPSTADSSIDDATLKRCRSFARKWGYGRVLIGNLFAFRSRWPKTLRRCADPVGSENNAWLKKMAIEADLIVAAWGNKGGFLERDLAFCRGHKKLQCLRLTAKDMPAHPLYVPLNTKLRAYTHKALQK